MKPFLVSAGLLVLIPALALAESSLIPPNAPPGGAPAPTQMSSEKTRDSWYIGFGLGTGQGYFVGNSGTKSFGDDGLNTRVALNFKIGATLNPRTLLGLDITALRGQGTVSSGFGNIDAAAQFTNYLLMGTIFPWEKGMFVRGGLGLGVAIAEVSGQTASRYGMGGDVGLGYAFWMGQHFNLTANVDYAYQYLANNNGENTSMLIGGMGFDWY